ncbi:MAG: hypothetical protein MZV70_28120 [Desulfobacterales bacterium]|nr:hypothetical protein [Desulfobacterales bacterium]
MEHLSCRPRPEKQGMFMNPTYDYDLIVIGAGIAGMVSAMKKRMAWADGWLLSRKNRFKCL